MIANSLLFPSADIAVVLLLPAATSAFAVCAVLFMLCSVWL